jgi:hypothetical protein
MNSCAFALVLSCSYEHWTPKADKNVRAPERCEMRTLLSIFRFLVWLSSVLRPPPHPFHVPISHLHRPTPQGSFSAFQLLIWCFQLSLARKVCSYFAGQFFSTWLATLCFLLSQYLLFSMSAFRFEATAEVWATPVSASSGGTP